MRIPTSPRRALPGAVIALVAIPLLGACASASPAADDTIEVLASFYPLQYVAQEVGGDRVAVESLTPPGTEPHDVELSPRQVRSVGDADVVVYLGGFQAAVDEAVEARRPQHVVDAAENAAVAASRAEPGGADGGDTADADSEDEDADHAGSDPHFWLDPTLLAGVADDVATALSEADPANADEYRSRATALQEELGALDADLSSGLSTCDRRVIVTAHEAFGYLAHRYDLEQVGVSGIDPEAEPSPARLRQIREAVTAAGVTTLFTETLVNPKVAETLAEDLGVSTAVLDPVESQVDPGTDYRGAMEGNLSVLREALGCR